MVELVTELKLNADETGALLPSSVASCAHSKAILDLEEPAQLENCASATMYTSVSGVGCNLAGESVTCAGEVCS
jgi:hypothetical protein